MHLECFLCHEKLLMQDQNTLISKQHSLVEEYKLYKENSKNNLRKTNPTELKQAKKDNSYLKNQIKKYSDMLKETKAEEDKLLKKLEQTRKKGKEKDNRASKLLNDIDKISLVINESNSILKSPSGNIFSKKKPQVIPSRNSSKNLKIKSELLPIPENNKNFGNKLT